MESALLLPWISVVERLLITATVTWLLPRSHPTSTSMGFPLNRLIKKEKKNHNRGISQRNYISTIIQTVASVPLTLTGQEPQLELLQVSWVLDPWRPLPPNQLSGPTSSVPWCGPHDGEMQPRKSAHGLMVLALMQRGGWVFRQKLCAAKCMPGT